MSNDDAKTGGFTIGGGANNVPNDQACENKKGKKKGKCC